MGIFRKRQQHKPEDRLGELLDAYSAPRPPVAAHSKIETIICWHCRRPNVFDARLSRPKTCTWCRAQL